MGNGTHRNSGKKADWAGRTHEAERDARRGTRAELVFILDASGSMAGLEEDTVGGFNAMIEENRELPGEATVSLVTFSNSSRVLLDRVDIEDVPQLTRRNYRCCGCTALLDAVGGAIEHIDLVQRVQPRGFEAQRVLFAVTTDGLENASRRYTYERIRRLIEAHREMGWEFIFIGANIDVEAEAERLGIDRTRAASYIPDGCGTDAVFAAAGAAVHAVRCGAALEESGWRDGLDKDVRVRGGR